jgi:hypothetical protein
MLKFITVLMLLALPATADNFSFVSASSYIISQTGDPVPPECRDAAAGTLSASAAFACTYMGIPSYSGRASGQLETGPYGIGVTIDLQAYQPAYQPDVFSRVDFQWSQDFVIEGAEGSGFVIATTTGIYSGMEYNLQSRTVIYSNLWGHDGYPFFDRIPIPVTFGIPYTLSMSGSKLFNPLDSLYYATTTVYVSDLALTDAAGNPLTGLSLVAVPEVSSWVLLATCAIAIAILRWGELHRTRKLC